MEEYMSTEEKRQIVVRFLGQVVDRELVVPDGSQDPFVALGLDSLDVLNIIYALEEALSMKIDDAPFRNLASFDALLEMFSDEQIGTLSEAVRRMAHEH
jgi:acyl carrier protein